MPRSDSDETIRTNDEHDGRNQHRIDGGESGRAQEHGPVGFWHPHIKSVRNNVIKDWALTTLLLMTAILGVMSLYWAVLFRVEQNLSSLVVWVVDFDGQVAPYTDTTPIVGPQIVKAALEQIAPTGALGWGSLPPSAFNNDPMEVRRQIYDFKAWAAVIINANATALLREAVQNGNTSYDPMGAAQVIYVEARDETTYSNYVTPMLTMFEQTVSASFGEMWAGMVLQQASTDSSTLANIQAAPQTVSPAIGFSTFNLRPFTPAVATPAISIGLIYLIIIAFFSFTFYLPHHMKFIKTPGKRPLHMYQLIIWRWCATVSAYFFLSLAYSLISLAFQIPFSASPASHEEVVSPADAYHHATFFVYWMLNWIGMTALGLACENVAMIIGQPWTALWLIFWVITNVSTSFYSIDLAPHFYYWGYAWPLHNIVEASRTLLFDLHSRLGLNFGILLAWCAVNTTLFPLACMFMGWKSEKAEKKEKEKKEEQGDEKKD